LAKKLHWPCNYSRDDMNFEQELERVAQLYHSEGYAVTLHPASDHLPSFAAGFRVDILATRTDGNVFVGVVRDRSELEAHPDISRQANVTNRQPGWRYDLEVVGKDDPLRRLTRDAREPSDQEIDESLGEAERLAQAGYLRAALVLAWAAVEASMRRVADDGKRSTLRTTPRELLGTLYGNGFLSRPDFDNLNAAFRLRSEIVHGLVPPSIDLALIDGTVRVARRLLTTNPDAQGVAG
jgi:hypothetical protein